MKNSLIKLLKHIGNYFWKPKKDSNYWLTRFVFLRLLGIVYFFAFLSLANQVLPLIGENGITPADTYLEFIGTRSESKLDSFIAQPTIFWVNSSDEWLTTFAWVGIILSIVIVLGYANFPLMIFIWFLYMSFVHVGQLWYGYGWEIQLLETGFLAVFLVPLIDPRPFPKVPTPMPVIWLLRWLTFRIYLGAGLIKLRGDSCWKALTCLYYHYETQPIPNPLSRVLHFLPKWFHNLGVLWNHLIELIVPFFIFNKGILRVIAGILLISFQVMLIFSGNLSFLNWLTIIPAISCLDDRFLKKILPKWIVRKAERAALESKPSRTSHIASWILLVIVAILSFIVIQNLISPNQVMNTSFNRVHLVNTYGAFGSIGKERNELIFEGTEDKIITPETEWKEYEFKAKPGNVSRSLPIVAPYHYRIDWQIWFAAMATPEHYPWTINFIWKLLNNDEKVLSLIEKNPFPEKSPEYIRVLFYKYEFLPLGEKDVWNRTLVGMWLPPLSKENFS